VRAYLTPFSYILLSATSQASTCLDYKNAISHELYKDEEYKEFICGEEKCTPEIFSARISIEAIDLGKTLKGCFATPIKKPKTSTQDFI
jgi:hypothetical protein